MLAFLMNAAGFIFGVFLLIGGVGNILGNLKGFDAFEQTMKGIGTIFIGLVIIVLCMG